MGETQGHPGGGGAGAGPAPAGRGGAQSGGRGGVHGADGVVELPDAGETGGPGHLRDRQAGGLEQHARGVGALGAGQGGRSGAQLRAELPVHPAGAFAVDDAVGDEPHGAAHGVGPYVPLGGAGHGVGAAAPTGAEARALGRGGGREEAHVGAFRGDGGAAGPAVDAGGLDGEEEHAVEPRVPAAHRLVPAVLVRHTVQCPLAGTARLAEIGQGTSGASLGSLTLTR